jgi:hypothetical protein
MIFKNPRFLAAWAFILFFGFLVFQFLHECGHGFGSKIQGYHISTGFDKVGDVGKWPSDPDFRIKKTIQGRWNLSDFLGPLVNWIFALVFTAIYLKQRSFNSVTLLLGAGATINALMRLFPMLMFFVAALQGRFVLEDETALGLSAIEGTKFPMPYLDFKSLGSAQSELFLSEPRIYFWPIVSIVISLACFLLIYRRLKQLSGQIMGSRFAQAMFILMPLLIWLPAFVVVNKLDNLIRLNWQYSRNRLVRSRYNSKGCLLI